MIKNVKSFKLFLIIFQTKNLHIQFIRFKNVFQSFKTFKTIIYGKNNLCENLLFISWKRFL